ncbi:MAG: hypothetical protein F4Z01_06940 [Gammaproteobacteria bacterium]|nr:hypothetical protein [Gammaproteobacteria bacterium]
MQEIITRTPVVVPEVHGIDLDIFDGMEAQLTQAHIDEGKTRKCKECPVALCLQAWLDAHQEQIGKQLTALVGRWSIGIVDEARDQCVLAPSISGLLEEWIDNYDDGQKLPPGRIYIERGGFVEDDRGKHQLWSIGMDVPDAYYIDPIGDDNTVNWGV